MGGIGLSQVIQATLVIAATSLAAGALGGLVALWRDRTFQSLALTVLYLMLYLLLVRGLCVLGEAAGLASPEGMYRVQQWLDPFAAMQSAHDPFPDEKAFIPSAYGFAVVMTLFAGLLTLYAMWRLRVWNPSGEPIMQREGTTGAEVTELDESVELEKRAKAHAAPGALRQVWANPVLWREVATLAYGRRPLLVKLAYGVVIALILWFAVSLLNQPGGRPVFAAARRPARATRRARRSVRPQANCGRIAGGRRS